MSWIRSDKAILHHPKTAHLQVLLKVDMDTVIGRLHRLWWWCLDYALDGDLSKHPGKVIEQACGIPIQTLIRSGLVDSRPYRRIHDWWANQGNYLKVRFKNQPEEWQRIEKLYKRDLEPSKEPSTGKSKDGSKTMDVTDVDLICTRTDGTDGRVLHQERDASLDAPRPQETAGNGGTKTPEIKSYEEAGPNDLCGPPKDMLARLKGLKK